jgi:hypothetical protein
MPSGLEALSGKKNSWRGGNSSMRKFVPALIIILLTPFYANAADVSVCSITQNPKGYDHQTVTLEGAAISLRQTTSRRGNDYSTFKLQSRDGCALDVFTWGHPTLSGGQQVRVEGEFETEHHQGRYTFYNELQAMKVTPISQ